MLGEFFGAKSPSEEPPLVLNEFELENESAS
jgi:hypothetical protein